VFQGCTSRLGVRQSMGRTGVCWDNAQAETFFASLKVECVHRTAIPNLDHARRTVGRYIEVYLQQAPPTLSTRLPDTQQRYSQLTDQQAQAA
jgi:putative transposase